MNDEESTEDGVCGRVQRASGERCHSKRDKACGDDPVRSVSYVCTSSIAWRIKRDAVDPKIPYLSKVQ
jgi:hypothetical protein